MPLGFSKATLSSDALVARRCVVLLRTYFGLASPSTLHAYLHHTKDRLFKFHTIYRL